MRNLIWLALLIPAISFAEVLENKGKITSVTLFTDRAEVERTIKVNLPAGKSAVRLTPVPHSIRADSLQVGGEGAKGTAILGVEFRNQPTAEDPAPRVKELRSQIEELEKKQQRANKEITRIGAERKLIVDVNLSQGIPTGDNGVVRPRTAQEMQGVLDFISTSTKELDNRELSLNSKLQEYQKELNALRRELSKLRPGSRTEGLIEVKLESASPGPATLTVSYQVPSAGWSPAYNLHVDESGAEPNFKLENYALISQNTGEDWKGVNLTLSTARPSAGLNRTDPNPIYLDVRPPIQPLRSKSKVIGGAAPMALEEMAADMAYMDKDGESLKRREQMVQTTAAIKNVGVLVYELPGKVDLLSNGSTEKVKVSDGSLAGSLVNISVPSRTREVFREAKLTNSTGQPLLPGQVAIFANKAFVGNQYIDMLPPEKEFTMPVGLSNAVIVDRKLVKKFEDDSGLVRSFRRIASEYEVSIQNLTDKAQELIILEPGVVSRNEQIKTEYSKMSPEPLAKDDQNRMSKNKDILEWHLALNGKDNATLNYGSTIEFKAGVDVSGIERIY